MGPHYRVSHLDALEAETRRALRAAARHWQRSLTAAIESCLTERRLARRTFGH